MGLVLSALYNGLVNGANHCFVNAVVQSVVREPHILYHLARLAAAQDSGDDVLAGKPVTAELVAVARELLHDDNEDFASLTRQPRHGRRDGRCSDARRLRQLLAAREGCQHLQYGQRCPAETTEVLFQALHEESERADGTSWISDVARIETTTTTTCSCCDHVSTRNEQLWSLPLRIMATLQLSLEKFAEPEKLTGDDSYACPDCCVEPTDRCEAERQINVTKVPLLLVVQIRRFAAASAPLCSAPLPLSSRLSF